MSIWIITTGNSDVQLKTKANWQNLRQTVRPQLGRGFSPVDGTDKRFVVPARVLGKVYSQPQAQEYWGDLVFPLLDNFTGQIQDEVIEQIILILTDQEAVFSSETGKSQHDPYWQDTCNLEPLITTYLKDKFPQAEIKPLLLQPKSSTKGLDDWDSVLKLIQEGFSNFDFPPDSTIYVSHQAGTPAISSAVQFEILLRFGQQVKFLVSSERDSKLTKILDRSTYLRGIRKQEAKALLDRHDYSGVKELLESYLEPEIKILLDAAILWNLAEFEEFADKLLQYPGGQFLKEIQERTKKINWWWTAYEAAYLGVVRLEQENIVEALFHSFRALEGLIKEWALSKYKVQIKYSNPKQPKTPYFTDRNLPQNLQKWFDSNKSSKFKNVGLFGKPLFSLLQESEQNRWKHNSDIQIVTGDIIAERNSTFHCLQGLQQPDLFKAWDTVNRTDWEARVLGCLNFIAEPKPPFTSLKEASLMSKVHQELEKAIASY
ncbi:MAG: hypothetical protein F6K47_26620 [Symploca sp. SIO2E6]|nr:hypothetical protein [Symploca sp. SIO2E6]